VKLSVILYLGLIGGTETAYQLVIRPFLERNETALDPWIVDVRPDEESHPLQQSRENVNATAAIQEWRLFWRMDGYLEKSDWPEYNTRFINTE